MKTKILLLSVVSILIIGLAAGAYWGIHTQRAVENFPVSGQHRQGRDDGHQRRAHMQQEQHANQRDDDA